jgi:hypothetical protein
VSLPLERGFDSGSPGYRSPALASATVGPGASGRRDLGWSRVRPDEADHRSRDLLVAAGEHQGIHPLFAPEVLGGFVASLENGRPAGKPAAGRCVIGEPSERDLHACGCRFGRHRSELSPKSRSRSPWKSPRSRKRVIALSSFVILTEVAHPYRPMGRRSEIIKLLFVLKRG